MLRVAVVGATGYTGYELLRLLQHHPAVAITELFSTQLEGEPTDTLFSGQHKLPKTFKTFSADEDYDIDFLFLAVPHATTHEYMHKLEKKSYRVIDLSADFRLNDTELYERYYQIKHANPQLLQKIPYGLPELYFDAIKHSRIVANPGCYSTTAILGLYPLCEAGLVEHVVIDAKSGVSGAGKTLKKSSLYCEVNEHLSAYATNNHRHQAELIEHLNVPHVFSPHLIPMMRGILCSSYVQTKTKINIDELVALYSDFYKECTFVTVQTGKLATTQSVIGSNRVEITLCIQNDAVIVFSASDNLIKGAAGQAIQNMNIMVGLNEDLGLPLLGQAV
jgi:N-acetyl-gamma-glutamyl-phosphate reductase